MEENNLLMTLFVAIIALIIILIIHYYLIKTAIISAMKIDRDNLDLEEFKKQLQLDNLLIALNADPIKMNSVNQEILTEYQKSRFKIIQTEAGLAARRKKVAELETELQQKATSQKIES